MKIKEIPKNPTREDVEKSVAIIDEMTCDFPLVGKSDRAHVFALTLLPFARDLIDGCTPLHLIESPTPGSGKGLMTDCCLYPATKGNYTLLSPAEDEEEWRKRLTACIAEAKSAIIIDNAKKLDSSSLAAVLTAEIWSDRILGKTQTISLPVRCVWGATANNLVSSTEIARRSISIRIEPEQDRPWLREGFKHPDLRSWVKDHRAELIEAALTIIQAWIAAGKPKPSLKPLGSFEDWSYVMGGILQNAGIDGFLGNILELYESADIEGSAWRNFVAEWWAKYKDKPVKTNDLYGIAKTIEGLNFHGDNDSAKIKSFGMKLSKQRNRIFDHFQIIFSEKRQRISYWQLVEVNTAENCKI